MSDPSPALLKHRLLSKHLDPRQVLAGYARLNNLKREGRSRRPEQRVLLEGPVTPHTASPREHKAAAVLESGNANPIRPVVRIENDRIDWGVNPGAGDEIGWGMAPFDYDDCLTTAIATTLQVPVVELPELNVLGRLVDGEDPSDLGRSTWEEIARWAADRGLEVMVWPKASLPLPRARWIGLVPGLGHCQVMCFDRLLFNPAWSAIPPPGLRLGVDKTLSDLAVGIAFKRKPKER